jgi:tetratricopeptide (TPR) repeat protein
MRLALPERLDRRGQWQQARRAFWEGRFDESVAAYRALIAADPQNWSAHGELGNVLYRQGEWDAAIEAFHDAALLLWQAGRQEDAWHLARIIGNLQPGRDQDLTRIFSAGGRDAPEYPSHSQLAKPTESQ